jgi:hypothetical protein
VRLEVRGHLVGPGFASIADHFQGFFHRDAFRVAVIEHLLQ